MDRSRRLQGFTLIEVITVLVILGILGAAVMPSMFNQQPFEARGYADELAAAIQYAQSVAVVTNCEVRFTISATGSASPGYSALQPSTTARCPTGGAWTVPVRRNDGTALSDLMPADITATPSVQFVFDPYGRISGAAPASVTVKDNNSLQLMVAVDPFSGYVTVQ